MSFSDWEEVRIGDICEVKGGKRLPKGSKLNIKPTNHPYIRIRDMYQHKYIQNNGELEFVDDETFKGISKYIANSGDVLIAIVGNTIGLVSIVGNSLDKASLTENCVKIINLKECLSEYIYYYLTTKVGQNEIKSRIVGTSQPKLPIYGVKDIRMQLPKMKEQRGIINILSTLDEKIEVNNQINKTLETMAQAMFKQWFVDFEFPNEDGEPYKSSGGKMVESELGMIPEGWEVSKLSAVAEITMGQSPKGTSYNEDSLGEVFYQGRTDFGERFPTRRLFTTEPKRMAKSGDVLMSVRAPVGDINIAYEDCCIGRGLCSIRSKNSYNSYMYYLMMSLKDNLNIYNGEGTVFGSINKDTLNNMVIFKPNNIQIDRYNRMADSLDQQYLCLVKENRNLLTIRDILLPKLMSGEIRVPLDN
jgi:type I restriction enzyme S subunit